MKKLFLLFLMVCSTFSLFAKGKYSENDTGKIVLINGELVSLEDYDKSPFKAVAIVYSIAKDGSYFLGVGLNTTWAPWATKDSYGYLGRIEGLEGLKEGYKAFDIIKEKDPNGFKNLEKNYPALYFASTYGKRYNVGKFKDGWYIPTWEEANPHFFLYGAAVMWPVLHMFYKDVGSFWCSNANKDNDYKNWYCRWGEGGAEWGYDNSSNFRVVVFRKFD